MAAGNQVGHGDKGNFDQATRRKERKCRQPIDSDERRAHERRFHCRSTAGDDRGAGVEQCGARVADQHRAVRVTLETVVHQTADVIGVKRWRRRQDELQRWILAQKKRRRTRHGGHCGRSFFSAAAGQQRNPGLFWIERILARIFLARDVGRIKVGQRMAHIFNLHAVPPVKFLFEREDAENFFDPLLHSADAVFAPGPKLRRDEVDHRNATGVHLAGHAKIEGRGIDDHGDVGLFWRAIHGAQQLAEFRIDFRQVAENFGHADHRQMSRLNDDLAAGGPHALPANADELERLIVGARAAAQRHAELRSIQIAGGFAGRKQDFHAALSVRKTV